MATRRRHLPLIIACMTVAGVGGGAFALIRSFINSAPAPKQQVVQEIHLIRPPPPPPDQPPPPPPPEQEKVQVPDPQQQPDPTPSTQLPPSENLGLDADGGAGGDAFGLVGNRGGRDITASGGSAFAWYASLLKDQILNVLNNDQHVRSGQYRVSLRVWVNDDGSVKQVQITRGSGSADRDRAIEADLQQIKHLSQAPPPGMPNVVSLEVRAQS